MATSARPLFTDLLQADHQVLALARSDSSAEIVECLGAEVLRGDVNDLNLVREAADELDGSVHLAFDNQTALAGDLAGASESDLDVVRAFGEVLAGTDTVFLAVGTGPTGDEQVDAVLAQNPR